MVLIQFQGDQHRAKRAAAVDGPAHPANPPRRLCALPRGLPRVVPAQRGVLHVGHAQVPPPHQTDRALPHRELPLPQIRRRNRVLVPQGLRQGDPGSDAQRVPRRQVLLRHLNLRPRRRLAGHPVGPVGRPAGQKRSKREKQEVQTELRARSPPSPISTRDPGC